jgi:hypothetical protein
LFQGDILSASSFGVKDCAVEHLQGNVEWDDQLAYGIPEFDGEHRKPAIFLNILHCASHQGVGAGAVHDLL